MGKKKFEEYLKKIKPDYSNLEEIEKDIWKRFGKEKSVFILDSSQFTSKTRDFGIVYFLHQFREAVNFMCPIIEKYNGKVLKSSADNLLVIFDDKRDSVDCAIKIQKGFRRFHEDQERKHRFGVCIGIASGMVLEFEDDVYGDTVNIASKLGEDLAKEGEILVDNNIYDQLKTVLGYQFTKKIRKQISSINLNYYKVKY